jgi:hypothetical protein
MCPCCAATCRGDARLGPDCADGPQAGIPRLSNALMSRADPSLHARASGEYGATRASENARRFVPETNACIRTGLQQDVENDDEDEDESMLVVADVVHSSRDAPEWIRLNAAASQPAVNANWSGVSPSGDLLWFTSAPREISSWHSCSSLFKTAIKRTGPLGSFSRASAARRGASKWTCPFAKARPNGVSLVEDRPFGSHNFDSSRLFTTSNFF